MRPSEFTTVLDDDRGRMRLEVNHELGRVFIHLTLKKWNPTVARAVKDGLTVCKGTLRAMGQTRLNVIIPDNDPKLLKFETRCGFHEIRRVNGCILMEMET